MHRKSSWSERTLVALTAALAALLVTVSAHARDERRPADAPGVVGDAALAELPRQARETLALIKRGGPFPYRKDGAVFQNRERRLPLRPRGYYTEYTVRTPGSRDRGPRRIVAGRGATGDPATGGEYYYTEDHYETFRRIRE
jgi:ribonuclease T1